jgi:hypothetical protein
MRKLLPLLATGLATALLFACSDNIVSPEQAAIDTKASLKVLVVDAVSGAYLPDAKVTLLATGSSAQTTTAGSVVIGNVQVGRHSLQVDKAGYTSVVTTTSVSGQEGEGVFIAYEAVATVNLYPLTAKLTGELFYEDELSTKAPAAGAEIRITISSTSILNKIYTATVGADGKYVFPALPAGVSYSISALDYTAGGVTYSSTSFTSPQLLPGKEAYVAAQTYTYGSRIQPPFNLVSRTESVDKNDTIFFVFNDSIDFKESTVPTIGASYYKGFYDVVKKGDTLKFVLFDNSEWTGNFTINFGYNFKSIKGTSLSGTISYYIKLNKEDLTKTKVANVSVRAIAGFDAEDKEIPLTLTKSTTLSDIIFSFEWKEIEGDQYRYRIYAKASKGDNVFVDLGYAISNADWADDKGKVALTLNGSSIYSNLGFTTPLVLPFASSSGQDGTIEFFVQAYENGYYASNKTPFNTADIKVIKITP